MEINRKNWRAPSDTVLGHFREQHLCCAEGFDDGLACVSVSGYDRIFDKELLELGVLVDFHYQFALSHPPTFIDKEVHDGFGNEVSDVFLDDGEVAVDEVLNDTGFHDHARALLLGV